MPIWSSCGRNTSSRPATLICVDRRAPWINGILDDLHHERLALEHLLLDGHLRFALAREHGASPPSWRCHTSATCKGRALQADVDEGGLHARQHARDLAQVDVAHQAALRRAFDVQLLHGAMLDHGHTGSWVTS